MQLAKISTRSRRPGFTLIEILVVIGIIAVLAALIGAGIMVWIPRQKERNTQGTIRTVNKIFQEQWTYVIEQAKKESPSTFISTNIGSDPTGERARVLWIKVRLMEAFPISFAEINNNATKNDPVFTILAQAIPANQRRNLDSYRQMSKGLQTANNPTTESAACLLMALSVSRGGSVLSPDQLGSSIVDTDGDGVNEIVDSWRNPLAFYRFAWGPTALPGDPGLPQGIQGLNPAPAGSKTARMGDPLDAGGLLFTWSAGAQRNLFETFAHRIANPSNPSVANYVVPVIVSAGPDGLLGLNLPTQAATAGLSVSGNGAADNTYSFNLKGN